MVSRLAFPLSSMALDRMVDLGRPVSLWWRDDDARAPTPELERLLASAKDNGVPLALAVIPEGAGPALVDRLRDESRMSILLHGHTHDNHAPAGEKRAEFGDHRPAEAMTREITSGRAKLESLFGAQFKPVFVPPWNRIGKTGRALLPGLGFQILSVYGPAKPQAPGLPAELNTHLDIMDWRAMRGLAVDEADRRLAALIDARDHDASEPIGLLTHHLQHDEIAWVLIGRLLAFLTEHPATRWIGPL